MNRNYHANYKTVRFRELSKRRSLPILTTTAQNQPANAKLFQPPPRPSHNYQDSKEFNKTTNSEQPRKVLFRQNSCPLSSTPAFAPVFQLNKEVLRKYTHSYSSEYYVYKKRHFTMQNNSKNLKTQLQLPRLSEVPNYIGDRSYCDSVTGSLQCSSLTSKNSERHPLFEKDDPRNRLLTNEPERVSQWLKATNK